jgi:hypothetical protein
MTWRVNMKKTVYVGLPLILAAMANHGGSNEQAATKSLSRNNETSVENNL